jgi:hypothetical protein
LKAMPTKMKERCLNNSGMNGLFENDSGSYRPNPNPPPKFFCSFFSSFSMEFIRGFSS